MKRAEGNKTSGGGSMGSHKHGISGHAGKSPRLRLQMKLAAESNERRAKKTTTEFKESVKEVFQK